LSASCTGLARIHASRSQAGSGKPATERKGTQKCLLSNADQVRQKVATHGRSPFCSRLAGSSSDRGKCRCLENRWIRFQPVDRLVPPLKITLSPASLVMIRACTYLQILPEYISIRMTVLSRNHKVNGNNLVTQVAMRPVGEYNINSGVSVKISL
jgi:hypothetical protein